MIMGAQGICFSVASNTALLVLTQLLAHGKVRRGRIGIAGNHVAVPRRVARANGLEQATAVQAAEVLSGGPAAQAGVRVGDVIVGLDGSRIEGIDDLLRVLDFERIGREVEVTLLRRGQLESIRVLVGEKA